MSHLDPVAPRVRRVVYPLASVGSAGHRLAGPPDQAVGTAAPSDEERLRLDLADAPISTEPGAG